MLLDTCALLWWTLDPEKLSLKAARACEEIERAGAFISSMSLWEIGIKIKNGKLDIGTSLQDYTMRLKKLDFLKIVPVDEVIWMENLDLKWTHRDPADRTIVATAKLNKCPIITSDEHMKAFYKRVIW